MLAILFLLAVWSDASQPAHAPDAAYAIIGVYIFFAAAMVTLTWANWWRDARLAGPAHAVDIVMFTALVMLTEGYTSPFFTFFMFVLLAAAFRWNWRATALTAMLLMLLYLAAGLIVRNSGIPFDLQRFVVRTGHLVILSLIVIWFGANQRWALFDLGKREMLAEPSLDESPLDAGLRTAMDIVRARTGLFLWRAHDRAAFAGLAIENGSVTEIEMPAQAFANAVTTTPFLYDLERNRGLRRDTERNLVELSPREAIAELAATELELKEGLAIPVQTDSGEGILLLGRIAGLSTDHISLGEQMAAELAAHIQRHALLRAAEESAEARSRLSLARDLHDSVVQFLASAAFRLEAMKRSNASGDEVEAGLNELKQLMLHEQRELRSFITSLRSGPLAAFNDLAKDLQALAVRLSRQWDIQCEFSALAADMMIPTRLRLDAQQLIREAVANAVRHASAKSVTIQLAALSDSLTLDIVNDGAEFKVRGGRMELPTSLKERVEQAGGKLDMARGMGVTKLSISLPTGESAR
ncbi:MAG TPA: histidine kinase [Sphingomicrobium sp.]|nr:histidine kinase [Sphingomicrobium sp.]